MTRIEQYANPQHSDAERCSGPEKDLRILLMVQDGTTPDRWRAFGRWSVPAEVIAQAKGHWTPTRPGAVLFLRISALPEVDGGNGSVAVFWDIPITRPMPAWHLIGLEGGLTYTLVLGLLRGGSVFQTVAGPLVFHAPSARLRRPVPLSGRGEPVQSRSASRKESHV